MTDRELMQQALDAMLNFPNDISDEMFESIRSLRARLAGWERVNMNDHKEGDLGIGTKPYAAQAAMVAQQTQGRMRIDPVTGDVGIGTVKWDASAPLVVHPHPAFKKPWVGLTDEEIIACIQRGKSDDLGDYVKPLATSRAVEAKLKEKNT